MANSASASFAAKKSVLSASKLCRGRAIASPARKRSRTAKSWTRRGRHNRGAPLPRLEALRHLWGSGRDGLRNPVRVRKPAGRESAKLTLEVVLDASDGWREVVDEKVGSAQVSVVRKTRAARIRDGEAGHGPRVRTVDMSIDRE